MTDVELTPEEIVYKGESLAEDFEHLLKEKHPTVSSLVVMNGALDIAVKAFAQVMEEGKVSAHKQAERQIIAFVDTIGIAHTAGLVMNDLMKVIREMKGQGITMSDIGIGMVNSSDKASMAELLRKLRDKKGGAVFIL